MPKLLMLKGLPGCGKTTRALEMISSATRPTKRVNNDELRLMIDGGKWSRQNEAVIRAVREGMIQGWMKNGYDVIIDNLNLDPKYEEQYRQLAALHNYLFEIIDMTDVPLHVCVARDRLREKPVGEKVIWRWYRDYIAPQRRRRWAEHSVLPLAIIVDLDGTLAEGIGGPNGRGPFEWDKVGNDKPVGPVLEVIRGWMSYYRGHVLFVSGRDSVCRSETADWLEGLGFPLKSDQCHLFMRSQGDMRPDTIVKREIFEQEIEGKYNVRFVIDDRKSVVQEWRNLGLYVMNVGLDIDF